MRLIIYTGKGGVGKTSASAATAYRLSEFGYHTLIISTDSAHSLGDSLNMDLGPTIKHINNNLDALEIDIIHEMKTKWLNIQNYISAFMLSQGVGEITAEEMAILPGMEMISALFYINQFNNDNTYDVIVMDTAPTGETLRLMSFPDVTNWYLDKGFSIIKRLLNIARVTVGKLIDIPLPSKEVIDSIEGIKNNMNLVKAILENPKQTTIRLVLNPERMVIKETMRAYTYLCLYNKNVEALIVNKMIPDDVGDGYFNERLKEQKECIHMIHDAFDPMEIKYCYTMRTELMGIDRLRLMADQIYSNNADPMTVYSINSLMRFITLDGINALEIKVPFVDSSKIELYRINNTTLIIQVGSQKRNIELPSTLSYSEVTSADLKDGKLVIKFEG